MLSLAANTYSPQAAGSHASLPPIGAYLKTRVTDYLKDKGAAAAAAAAAAATLHSLASGAPLHVLG